MNTLFELEKSIQLILNNTFQKESFKSGQKEAIFSLINKKDTIVIFPTGAGKSLIYQLASFLFPNKITLVLSPLISLMKDQVDSLKKLGIHAEYCNSSQDELDQLRILGKAVKHELQLLYLSPEKALSNSFTKILNNLDLAFVAVDEAHCISKWGGDFRQEYKKIHQLRKGRNFPFIAVTASATNLVIEDITTSLKLVSPNIFKKSYFKENLRLNVLYFKKETEKKEKLLNLLEQNINEKSIIYCSTRKKVDELYKFLKDHNFKVGKYHAGRTDNSRNNIQNKFQDSKVNILIATNAFGMGIDDSKIRQIIHYQIPASVEDYYQEIGRAGRDGGKSTATLFFSNGDVVTQKFIQSKNSDENLNQLQKMKDYALTRSCRQVFICRYFDETISNCGNCDNCLETHKLSQEDNRRLEFENNEKQKILNESHPINESEKFYILNFIKAHPAKFGKNLIVQTLNGKSSKLLKKYKLNETEYFGKLKHIPREAILTEINSLKLNHVLKVKGVKYPKLYHESSPPLPKEKGIKKPVTEFSSRLKELKSYRDNQARKLRWKKYMVLKNDTLAEIIKQKPKNLNELEKIKGIGQSKISKFGEDILEIIHKS